jgi:hypothetical protein
MARGSDCTPEEGSAHLFFDQKQGVQESYRLN